MDLAMDFVAYVTTSLYASSEYRHGFASAVFIGLAAHVTFRFVHSTWKSISLMFAASKVPVTKDGPSAYHVVSRSIKRFAGLAMMVAIWRVLS